VQANGLNDFINKISVAVQNSPLADGKKALVAAQVRISPTPNNNKVPNARVSSPWLTLPFYLTHMQAGNYDKDAVRSCIEKAIESNKVVVYSWSGCPFCKNAKALLNDLKVDYVAIELDQIPDGKAIRAELAAMTGRTSVPNIWINGQGVGGFNDGPGLNTLNKKRELKPLLEAAGALKA
jgi:glutaredoxin 3